MSTSSSGSTSRTAAQVVWTDRSPSRPRRSQPPARRICSGTQWPTANGGSSHSRPTTRTGGWPRSRRSATVRLERAEPLPEVGDDVDRSVLRVGHRPDGRDRVEDPLDRGRLERDDADVGVDRPGDLVDLAVPDGAHRAQLLGQDQVRIGRLQGGLVELVERRPAVDRLADETVDLARRALGQVVGRAGDRRDRRAPRAASRTRGSRRRARRPARGRTRSRSPTAGARRSASGESSPGSDGTRRAERPDGDQAGLSASTSARAAARSVNQMALMRMYWAHSVGVDPRGRSR